MLRNVHFIGQLSVLVRAKAQFGFLQEFEGREDPECVSPPGGWAHWPFGLEADHQTLAPAAQRLY